MNTLWNTLVEYWATFIWWATRRDDPALGFIYRDTFNAFIGFLALIFFLWMILAPNVGKAGEEFSLDFTNEASWIAHLITEEGYDFRVGTPAQEAEAVASCLESWGEEFTSVGIHYDHHQAGLAAVCVKLRIPIQHAAQWWCKRHGGRFVYQEEGLVICERQDIP